MLAAGRFLTTLVDKLYPMNYNDKLSFFSFSFFLGRRFLSQLVRPGAHQIASNGAAISINF